MSASFKITYDSSMGDFLFGHYCWRVSDGDWRDSGFARSEKSAHKKIAKALRKKKNYVVAEGEL